MSGIKEKIQGKTGRKLKQPPMYSVLMHNDHYTSMDFVVSVLKSIFHKGDADANQIMMKIHKEGLAKVGIYTYDIARTKIDSTHRKAKDAGFPLRCTMETE